MPDAATWTNILIATAIPCGGFTAWLLNRRYNSANARSNERNADTAAVVAGTTLLDRYAELVAKYENLASRMTAAEGAVIEQKGINAQQAHDLRESNRKNKILARAYVTLKAKVRERDDVITSLTIVMATAADGRESVQGALEKASDVLKSFVTGYSVPPEPGREAERDVDLSELVVDEILAEAVIDRAAAVVGAEAS